MKYDIRMKIGLLCLAVGICLFTIYLVNHSNKQAHVGLNLMALNQSMISYDYLNLSISAYSNITWNNDLQISTQDNWIAKFIANGSQVDYKHPIINGEYCRPVMCPCSKEKGMSYCTSYCFECGWREK